MERIRISDVTMKQTGKDFSLSFVAKDGTVVSEVTEFAVKDGQMIMFGSLEDGEAVGVGTHDELMQNCAVYQEIYYSQFPKEVTAQ